MKSKVDARWVKNTPYLRRFVNIKAAPTLVNAEPL